MGCLFFHPCTILNADPNVNFKRVSSLTQLPLYIGVLDRIHHERACSCQSSCSSCIFLLLNKFSFPVGFLSCASSSGIQFC